MFCAKYDKSSACQYLHLSLLKASHLLVEVIAVSKAPRVLMTEIVCFLPSSLLIAHVYASMHALPPVACTLMRPCTIVTPCPPAFLLSCSPLMPAGSASASLSLVDARPPPAPALNRPLSPRWAMEQGARWVARQSRQVTERGFGVAIQVVVKKQLLRGFSIKGCCTVVRAHHAVPMQAGTSHRWRFLSWHATACAPW